MKQQGFQRWERRDENDNIIRAGPYGKNTPLINATNDAILDYIGNNLDVLYDLLVGLGGAIDEEGNPILPDGIKAALQAYVTSAAGSATSADSSAKAAATSAAAALASENKAKGYMDSAQESAEALASVSLADGLSFGIDPNDGGLNIYYTSSE